ncbi:Scr1 family TA system antitoxin-like transcriptional regulator [Streptomyces caniscabiei]|uniref:Scr1 family TA system antitoxin-like transcriptional regulator n=2 Tax=Streptomyces caniscabiei TaxID=2746961 RepID=UPI0029CA0E64|nr:Scr1 family TA system antitoxin-like transcriptional regulator [Streptomyces caniscabiei]
MTERAFPTSSPSPLRPCVPTAATTRPTSTTNMRVGPGSETGTRLHRAAAVFEPAVPGLRVYASTLVPGLLQVPRYRMAVRAYPFAGESGHFEVDLPRDIPAVFVLEESVLHHQVGDPDIMTAQISHLIGLLSVDSDISIAVIPLQSARSVRQLPREPFAIINGHKVLLPVASLPLEISHRDQVSRYSSAFFWLHQAARTGAATRRHLESGAALQPTLHADRKT